MDVDILELDVGDDRLVDELLALKNDAARADTPDRPLPNARAFRNNLRRVRPWQLTERRVALVEDRAVGYLEMTLPTTSNRHLAEFQLLVHPGYRRQRIGRELLRDAYELATRHGRQVLNAGTLITWEDGPSRPDAGELFLQEEGFEPALTEVLRTARPDALAPATEQRLYAEAEQAAADYRIVPVVERVPDELVASVAALGSIFLAEAPIGELDLEPDPITVERVRKSEQSAVEDGILRLSVLAVAPDETVVAMTDIHVPDEPGDWAHQEITLVHPDHRGHRLGLRIKLENHRQLRRLCGGVHTIETGNAAVNEHMIGINRLLGFQPLDAYREYQRRL